MEINERMSKRFAWLAGVAVLVGIGLLVACGSNYNASADGLVLVTSQGSGLIETFSFNLNNGHYSDVSNSPAVTSTEVCVLNGFPTTIVVDPAGSYAYAILTANSSCSGGQTGILAFKINSDGTTTQAGSLVPFNSETVLVQGTTATTTAPVVPGPLVIDRAGKFLFVADRATTDSSGRFIPGAVSVFTVGSGGSVAEVSGSPFFTTTAGTTNLPTTAPQASLDIASVAPSPTVFPAIGLNGVQSAVCSTPGLPPPTTEYLYAVDGLGNQVFEFQVNTSSGVLTNPSSLSSSVPVFPADQTPAGVAVDPCNRFVYVSDSLTNKVSAYTICNGTVTQSSTCTGLNAGALVPVANSPFSLSGSSNNPGPILVDPFGNNVYVLGTLSNTISMLKISPISGSVSALSTATVATGIGPTSMAIRGDDSWLFVANFGSAGAGGTTVSQYSITPATGLLTAQPAILTDNYPYGVAVK